jgi:hypothetical protein
VTVSFTAARPCGESAGDGGGPSSSLPRHTGDVTDNALDGSGRMGT